MLKKFFVAAVLSIFVLVGGQVNAMPYSEMFLGSLTVGSSYFEMVNIYGEPMSQKISIEDMASCSYGDSVGIGYNSYAKKIYTITVTANNGWKTPSGLAVGDNISKALDICGEPDYKKIGAYKTAYCYVHRNGNTMDYGFFILFNNESGKILMLELTAGGTMVSFDSNEGYPRWMENMVK